MLLKSPAYGADSETEKKMALIQEYLGWESSEVDWCEHNFHISSFVAEFWNTVSNILFFLIPPLLIYLFRQYARQVDPGVNVVWLLLVVVGAGSVYFHATLSLVGQLVDEIAIIWVVMAAGAMWWPKKYMPLIFQQDRQRFKNGMLVFAALSTGLACLMPEINCFALFVLGVPATALLIAELRNTDDARAWNLGLRCALMWVIALVSWISDKAFCSHWKSIGFPYLHCSWHIFVLLAAYQACVLFAYFDAQREVPEQMPVLIYWPKDSFGWLGIPYVTLKCIGPKPVHKSY